MSFHGIANLKPIPATEMNSADLRAYALSGAPFFIEPQGEDGYPFRLFVEVVGPTGHPKARHYEWGSFANPNDALARYMELKHGGSENQCPLSSIIPSAPGELICCDEWEIFWLELSAFDAALGINPSHHERARRESEWQ